MRKILGIGETVLDVVFKGLQPRAAVPGGSTFNSIVSLGRTVGVDHPEVQIYMITEMGADHVGDIVLDFMQKNHIDTQHVIRHADMRTYVSMAFLNENNDAQYEFYKDSTNEPRNLPDIDFAPGDIVVFGSFFAINPGLCEFVEGILRKAHEAGAILVYDINFRDHHLKYLEELHGSILENCRLSDIVRASSEDCGYVFGTTDATEVYANHISPLCDNFIYTDGPRAIEVFSPDLHNHYNTIPCNTVSTIGAGDSFNAGIVYALVHYDVAPQGGLQLTSDTWTRLVDKARRFSANVCQSMENYVDTDFISKL